jgi:hypothetical protein
MREPATLWPFRGPEYCPTLTPIRRSGDCSGTSIANIARNFGRPASARAWRQELVVSAGNRLRNDTSGRALIHLEAMNDDPLQSTIIESEDEDTAPGAESYWRLLPLVALLLAAVFVVKLTNLRFVLSPPLVVIGFEMFLHTGRCPWATGTWPCRLSVC